MSNGDKAAQPLIGMDYQETGLTKREHFAGLAMQGMLADGYCTDSENTFSDCAIAAKDLADTLLDILESMNG
jgi:hypothetical protein